MQISLQTILDLVLSSIKRLYQTELKITSTTKDKKHLQIILESDDDKTRKYEVEIWFNYDEKNNDFVIRSIDLGLLIKSDEFPVFIGDFTSSNLVEFNQATSTLFRDVRFKPLELLEVA